MRIGAVLAVVVWALGAVAALAGDRSETVVVGSDVPFVQVAGAVTGWDVVHYRVQATAGQQFRVQLTSDRDSTRFNIVPPGGRGGAIFQGTTGGNLFVGRLQETGVYVITVFQDGSQADRALRSTFALGLSLSPALQGGEALNPRLRQPGAYVTVFGLGGAGALPLRRLPNANAQVLHRVEGGQRLLLRQCRMSAGEEWCFVTSQGTLDVRGWANGRHLRNE